VGLNVEAKALCHIKRVVVQKKLDELALKKLEESLLPIKDDWDAMMAERVEVEQLYHRKLDPGFIWWLKTQGFMGWLRYSLLYQPGKYTEPCHQIYLRQLAERRAVRILIALRRYRNRTRRRPDNIDVLKSSTAADVFIDPISNGGFVYKLNGDSFMLYSIGRNKIDDGGLMERRGGKAGTDDWLIWPVRDPNK